MKRPSAILVAAGALLLAGCGVDPTTGRPRTVGDALTAARNWNSTHLPLIGKNLLLVGQIVVQAECSPLPQLGAATASSVLHLIAPDAAAADKVISILQANAAVAAQLCPFVTSVQAGVGRVPAGAPAQTVPDAR